VKPPVVWKHLYQWSKHRNKTELIPDYCLEIGRLIYRVAQNKIPHQTICNIFATSGQILKILEAI